MTKAYSSKKWVFFFERPTPLLKREYLAQAFLWLDRVCRPMKLSRLLAIGAEDKTEVWLIKKEDGRNYRLAVADYKSGRVLRKLAYFLKKIQDHKEVRDGILNARKSWRTLGPILLYTHYLERYLTQLDAKQSKPVFVDISEKNEKLRDYLAKILYPFYERALEQFKRNYNFLDIEYYLSSELRRGRKLDAEEIKERKFFYVALFDKRTAGIYTGPAAVNFLKKESFHEDAIGDRRSVSGIIAQKGKVKGVVAIIKKLTDFKKSVAGKIVIAPGTMVDYVPYLRNIAGLVTDEGGVNCHAAVVAREFKLPCLVGTKIATKIFKDGDLVEVDAEKGTVKKIK